MATTLKDLIAEREALEAKIAQLRATERSAAIDKIRALIEENGLSQEDIFSRSSSAKASKTSTTKKVAAKYRDPASGNEWSGRGIQPKWLAGKNRDDYLVP